MPAPPSATSPRAPQRRPGGRGAHPGGVERGCADSILRSIRRIIRFTDIHSHKLRVEYGVTAPQLACLLRIAARDRTTVTDLASELTLSASTLVGIVDRLESRGFVRRERSSRDRRQIFIFATKEGRDLLGRTPSPLQERLAAALGALPGAEREEIAKALERIVELLQIGPLDASPILATGLSLDSQ